MEINEQEQCKVSRCIDCDKYALWSRTVRGYVLGTDDCLHHHKIVRWDDEACEDAMERGWLEEAKISEYLYPPAENLVGKRKGICSPNWADGYMDRLEGQPGIEYGYCYVGPKSLWTRLVERVQSLLGVATKGCKGG